MTGLLTVLWTQTNRNISAVAALLGRHLLYFDAQYICTALYCYKPIKFKSQLTFIVVFEDIKKQCSSAMYMCLVLRSQFRPHHHIKHSQVLWGHLLSSDSGLCLHRTQRTALASPSPFSACFESCDWSSFSAEERASAPCFGLSSNPSR